MFVFASAAISWGAESQAPNPPDYHALTGIPLAGKGGWDDLSVDSVTHRLYVSHSDRVIVFDTERSKVVGEIPDTPGVHGIAIAPELKMAFSSNGREDKVSVIDLETLATKGKISVGGNPDAIVYEPGRQEVYVFNGRGKSVSVIDAKGAKVVATITLAGKPEFAAVDAQAGRVFVNIEDHNLIAVLDTRTHAVVASWPIDGCESPTGLAIDRSAHRLFSVCENQKMVMLDSTSGHVIASVPTGEGTDGAAFDPQRMLAFSSNGRSATVTIAREGPGDQLTVVQQLKTHAGARTMTLDPATHRIYLPAADMKPGAPGDRPKPVDGTQQVLVYGP